MCGEPLLTHRCEDGQNLPVLLWRFTEPLLAISSAALGGGIGPCSWLLNATVPMSYARNDPARHLGEIAARLDLHGPGVGLLTGVDVADVVAAGDGGPGSGPPSASAPRSRRLRPARRPAS